MIAEHSPPPPPTTGKKGGKGKAKAQQEAAKKAASDAEGDTSLNGSPKKPLPVVQNSDIMHRIGIDLNIDPRVAAHVDEPSEYLYAIQLLDDENKYTGSLMEVRAKRLSRDRLSFSKTILKKYLRTCLVRDAKIGAPWIVRHVIANRYGIPTHPSEEVIRKNNQIKNAKLNKRRKIDSEPVPEAITTAEAAAAPPPPKKRKSKAKAQKTAEEIEAEEAAKWKEAEAARRAEKRKSGKYPWEDLDLGNPTNRELLSRTMEEEVARRLDRPKPVRDVGMDGDTFELMVGAYHFLISCGKTIHLSNFTLDEFEASLHHETHVPFPALLVEAHASMINVLLQDQFKVELPAEPARATRVAARSATTRIGKQAAAAAAIEASGGDTPAASPAPSEEIDELESDVEVEADATMEEDEVDEETKQGGKAKKEEGANDYENTPEYNAVMDAAAQMSAGWEGRYLTRDTQREGWEAALIGAIFWFGDYETFPRKLAILAQLTGVEHPDALKPARPHQPLADSPVKREGAEEMEQDKPAEETVPFVAHTYATVLERYAVLAFEDKVAILTQLAEWSAGTKAIRRFYDECESQLTELRKERIELSRVRKNITERRQELDGTNKEEDNKQQENGSGGGDAAAAAEDADPSGTPAPASAAKEPAQGEDEEEEDELASSSEDDNSELSDEDDGGGRGKRAKKTASRNARQQALQKKAEQQRAAEEARRKERQAAQAAHRAKVAANKQLSSERKRLDEEQLKLENREDAIEREFRRLSLAPRLVPLGRDRFFAKYWWLDGIGHTPLVNAQNQAQYLVGRLFVQGCSEQDMAEMEEICEVPRRWKDVQARIPEEYGGEAGILRFNEWAVYSEAEDIDQLIAWLRGKGVREAALKHALLHYKPYLSGGMARRKADLEREGDQQTADKEGRRTTRPKSEVASAGRLSYMRYQNLDAQR